MQLYKKVIRDKKGKLSLEPKFYNRGCYFYFIPKKFQSIVNEGEWYFFKFGSPMYKNKTDIKGRRIYTSAAIPQYI
ncbi:MAG: hypothetical protein WC346_05825 [Methanogenium sp.]|jgi:hypothetical protein